MKVVKLDDVNAQDWDLLLEQSSENVCFCQSSTRAALLCELEQAKVIFLQVQDGGEIVMSLLLFHRIHFDRCRGIPLKKAVHFIRGESHGWLEWMRGPVIYDQMKKIEGSQILLEWIEKYACEQRITTIQGCSQWMDRNDILNEREFFLQRGYAVQTWGTYLVDISEAQDNIWDQFKSSTRRSIKKAQKKNARILKIGNTDELQKYFYTTLVKVKQRAQPFSTYQRMFEKGDNTYQFYVAMSSDDKPIAVLGMYLFAGMATEISSAMTEEAYDKKIPAQDLLHWEMMLSAKRSGCHTFNLAGFNPESTEIKEVNIKNYKSKWGGQYKESVVTTKSSFVLSQYEKMIQGRIRSRDRSLAQGISVEVQSEPFEGWDNQLKLGKDTAGICQTEYRAHVMKELERADPFFIRVKKGLDILADCLVIKRYSLDRSDMRKTSPIIYLDCKDGPVLYERRYARESISAILKVIDSIAGHVFPSYVEISSHNSNKVFGEETILMEVFEKYAYSNVSWGTFLLDLKLSEEVLFSKCDKKCREKIRKAKRMGVEFKLCQSIEDFKRFILPIYQENGKRNMSERDYEIMIRNDYEKRYHYFYVLDSTGVSLAVGGMHILNGVACRIANSVSRKAKDENVPAGDLLTWESICLAKRLGAETFNFAGHNPHVDEGKDAAIRDFKGKWGGHELSFYEFSKWNSPILNHILRNNIPSRIRNYLEMSKAAK